MPLQVNIFNIAYIAFRLSPFIIVCFFTLESFLNWNLKGIVYLFGLLFACAFNILLSSTFPYFTPPAVAEATGAATGEATSNVCVALSLGEGNQPLSNLPLSTAVFSYTLFYLLTHIINLASPGANFIKPGQINEINSNELSTAMTANTPTLILFPILIISDVIWNLKNGCSSFPALLATVVFSGLIGIMWASIIASTKNPSLIYISNSMGNVCSKPTATKFRCRTKNVNS